MPAITLRRYSTFYDMQSQSYDEGIRFYAKDGTIIDNFPEQHSNNCITKHQSTKLYFKPMVRIIKNMRNRMIEEKMIVDGLAPSYYLEGLLYNVPYESFGGSYVDTFASSVNWLINADRSDFVCANNFHYLLREGSPVTWRAASCDTFLSKIVDFWDQY